MEFYHGEEVKAMATVYDSKHTNHGIVQIENGGYQKYALMVNGEIKAQSDDWNYIKNMYDSYN